MSEHERYTYRVHWSSDDEGFVGTVAELPSISVVEESHTEAMSGIFDLASAVVADLQAQGEPVPAPFEDREFSGKFMLRVPPEVHRRLSVEAEEQHVSLNRLINARLLGSA